MRDVHAGLAKMSVQQVAIIRRHAQWVLFFSCTDACMLACLLTCLLFMKDASCSAVFFSLSACCSALHLKVGHRRAMACARPLLDKSSDVAESMTSKQFPLQILHFFQLRLLSRSKLSFVSSLS